MMKRKGLLSNKLLFCYIIFTLLLYALDLRSEIPIKQIAGLKSITFYEMTGSLFSYTYSLNSYELNHRFSNHMNSSERDFEGWIGVEFFDVFYSNSNGDFNTNGEFISVEATFDVPFGGGGLNIAEVELNFNDGHSQFGSFISSFQSLGSTYMAGSEKKGADCDLKTFTTMGFTISSNPEKLRITVGFKKIEHFINYIGCQNDGYSVVVNGKIYDVNNPTGTEYIQSKNGCDSIVYVNLFYSPSSTQNIYYDGCEGDNYSVQVNGTIYNESNPFGTEMMTTSKGCDSIVYINLKYSKSYSKIIEYKGCKGDDYSIKINDNIYSEQNPIGIEIMESITGCDSIIYVDLTFSDIYISNITYRGCENDGYHIKVNGNTYNQNNPKGTEIILSDISCDTLLNIDLFYGSIDTSFINYDGCQGDGFTIEVNGKKYSENINKGTEYLTNYFGCDSIVKVDLKFKDCEKIHNELCKLFIPNIFSPDQDGWNDNFLVKFNEYCEIMEFQISIFDRWGNKLFYSTDKEFLWDGRTKGNKLVLPGVYTYLIRYVTIFKKEKIISGDITVIR